MRKFSWVPLLLALAGCADEIPEDVSAEMDARRAATQSADDTTAASVDVQELLEEAPAGGYLDWVRDIHAGLDSVAADAVYDRGDALHSAQELYYRRYEYLVDFYGHQGAAPAGPGLAQAIEQVGTQLQDLMRLLSDDQTDGERIAAAISAIKDALAEVETQGRAAGLPPEAPRLPVAPTD